MFEIVVTFSDREEARAEADSPENALFAAQTLFDEVADDHGVQGARAAIAVTFYVDGTFVRRVEGKRP